VILAASVPALPGERVLELGTGAGAALLCLGARVAGLSLIGIERDPEIAEIARTNLAVNGLADALVIGADIEGHLPAIAPVHHVLANPPYHDAAGTPSPVIGRRAAKQAAPGLLQRWTGAAARLLCDRGTLSLILPAGRLSEACLALATSGYGSLAVYPLWPKAGRIAKLAVLRCSKGGRAPARILPGMVLHEADGHYSKFAEAVLRGGAGLGFQDGETASGASDYNESMF